jgi:low affinity Fe/Cu permease
VSEGHEPSIGERADRAADRLTRALGSLPALAAAVALIIGWAATGPLFGFSETWQLVINTTTTVITFLMVFVIQMSQNRQGEAIQLKLDEIIRAIDTARDEFVDLEDASRADLETHAREFADLAGRLPHR